MSRRHLLLGLVLTLALPAAHVARANDEIPLGFDGPRTGALPSDWRHVKFPSVAQVTSYGVAAVGTGVALRAVASRSASLVVRRVPDSLARLSSARLRWRWRVDRTVPAGDGRSKETDDFPARVWVGFKTDWSRESWLVRREAEKARERYGFEPPGTWVGYVWTGRGRQQGEAFDEPYDADRFKCIALRTAGDALGAWCSEDVDPRADWRRLFHGEPPPITAIAIMTDADDTASDAEALFADMAFVSADSPGARLDVKAQGLAK